MLVNSANRGIGAATVLAFAAHAEAPDGVADIADAVVFLASEQARWITGQVLQVAGGHALR